MRRRRHSTTCSAAPPRGLRTSGRRPRRHTSPEYTPDKVKFFSGISTFGKAAEAGLRTYAVTHHLDIPGMPADPDTPLTPRQMQILDTISAGLFPKLAGAGLGRRSLADP